MAQIEAIVEPDCVGNDLWRESVTLIGINDPSLLEIGRLTCQYHLYLPVTFPNLDLPTMLTVTTASGHRKSRHES